MEGRDPTQLPMTEVIVDAETVSIWDGVDVVDEEAALAVSSMRHAGDRMLLVLAIPGLTPTEYRVAAALAHYGWISWPTGRTIARQLGIAQPHVSKALKGLARKCVVRRRMGYVRGRRGAQTLYVFHGPTVYEGSYTVTPDTGPTVYEGSYTVTAETGPTVYEGSYTVTAETGPTVYEGSYTVPPETEPTVYESEPEPKLTVYDRSYTNQEPENKPGLIDIDIDQSINSGSSGSVYEGSYTEPPDWWHSMCDRYTAGRPVRHPSAPPDWTQIEEFAALARWDEASIREGAETLVRVYHGQIVTDSTQLLRKIIIGVASGRGTALRAPAPPRRRYSYAADRLRYRRS